VSARSRFFRAVAAAVGLTLGASVVAACGPTLRDVPLPGAGVSGPTVTIRIQFDEALNLAQGAAVKVNGVNSGKVQSVSAKDFKAIAVLKVKKSAQMRSNATARLRYTTPLGELFVDVSNPSTGPLLHNGQELPAKNATTAPTVEDALSEASLLVNGGGLNQLQTVTDQLNTALDGREGTVRQLLDRANTFLSQANATTADIDQALDAMAGLSTVLHANQSTISAAMKDIRPAAAVLRQNTPGFTQLLAKLAQFASTANNVVGKTRSQILQMVTEVTPVLQEFLDNKDVLGPSFDDLVHVSKLLNEAVPGDYANMRLTIELDKIGLPNILGPGGGGSTGTPGGLLGALLSGLGLDQGGSIGLGSLSDLLTGALGGKSAGKSGATKAGATTSTTKAGATKPGTTGTTGTASGNWLTNLLGSLFGGGS
jgi:phospholipid/cholesterol/gamma-HCH transport system substrate-binding protein